MPALKIRITKFISAHQPGFVECSFVDAHNKEHIVEEKVPVVTLADLDANSTYPQDGIIACEIVKEQVNADGQKIITISTARPWSVETMEGLTAFDVLEEQLIESDF